MKTEKVNFIRIIFRGIGQIVLQENAISGLLILIALFLGSWKFGVATLLATVVAYFTSLILKFDKSNIEKGLYGFSPALVGIAFIFFFEDTIVVWVGIILGSIVTAIVQDFFIKRNIPIFTFPFIVVTWIAFVGFHYGLKIPQPISLYADIEIVRYQHILSFFRNYGQVLFQQNILASLLIFLAITISSLKSSLYSLIAIFIAVCFSYFVSQPSQFIQLGIFGFNPLLTALVFSSYKQNAHWLALVGIFLTIILEYFFRYFHLFDAIGGVLTFPFVLATWITLFINKKIINNTKSISSEFY